MIYNQMIIIAEGIDLFYQDIRLIFTKLPFWPAN